MRRVLGFLFVLAGASSAIAAGAPAAKPEVHATSPTAAPSDAPSARRTEAPKLKLAPADEYFGPLKMSVLGIRNQIHDLGILYAPTYDFDHNLAKRIMAKAVLAEASLRDWAQKYPSDSQIPRYVYLLDQLYARIQLTDAQVKAKACTVWLETQYSATWYARNAKTTIHEAALPGASASPAPNPSDTGAAPAATPSVEPSSSEPSLGPLIPAGPMPTSAH